MTVQAIVEVVVLLLAVLAAWLSLRPAPPLEWERLWKVILATVIRGDVQTAGKGQDEWWSRLTAVPFHPAGRNAYDKLLDPDLEKIPIPALQGERSLVERLSQLDEPRKRYTYMYRDAEAASEALLADPAELGRAYDPSVALGPKTDWESIAVWNADVQSAVVRRLNDVVVAVIGMSTEHLLDVLPRGSAWSITDPTEANLMALLPENHQRLVIIAQGLEACTALKTLYNSPALRDRLVVFLSIAAPLQSGEMQSWMQTCFQHKSFDTELNRRTLYLSISDPGSELNDSRHQVFPTPQTPPSGWEPIESVDLGLLPMEQQDPTLLARALWVLLAFCFHSR